MSRRDKIKAQLAQRKREKRKKRMRWTALILSILLLLISRCTCVEEPLPGPPGPPGPAVEVEPEPPREPLPRRPRIDPIERPRFETEPAPALPWLDDFRLQVAARSPRLADCFVGAERPGRMRWTAAVDPGGGLVSEQLFEPVSAWDMLTAEQEACIEQVMAQPGYTLDAGDGPSTPTRVSLVIEF